MCNGKKSKDVKGSSNNFILIIENVLHTRTLKGSKNGSSMASVRKPPFGIGIFKSGKFNSRTDWIFKQHLSLGWMSYKQFLQVVNVFTFDHTQMEDVVSPSAVSPAACLGFIGSFLFLRLKCRQWTVKVRWRTLSHTPDGGLASTAVIEPKLITFSLLIMLNRSSVIEMDICCSVRTTLSKLT